LSHTNKKRELLFPLSIFCGANIGFFGDLVGNGYYRSADHDEWVEGKQKLEGIEELSGCFLDIFTKKLHNILI
jgi:hypothetical protein